MQRRILWVSDHPLRATGFGRVTRELHDRLRNFGFDFSFLGWWSDGLSPDFNGQVVRQMPSTRQEASACLVKAVAQDRPDYIIFLADVPWIDHLLDETARASLKASRACLIIYFPVDGATPAGLLPSDWVDILLSFHVRVAMSRFGEQVAARSGVPSTYIPHGCDLELFAPLGKKEEAKAPLGYAGRFVILSDVRHHRRKLIPRTLDIVMRLRALRDDFVLHLHANWNRAEETETYLYDFRKDVAFLGLTDHVVFSSDPGLDPWSDQKLASLYAAADALLLTSYGEGFGLPILQAASAGAVAIVPDHSACRELVDGHGDAIPSNEWTIDEFGLVRPFVDRSLAVSSLSKLIGDRKLCAERSHKARAFAAQYSWDRVAKSWRDLLALSSSYQLNSCARELRDQFLSAPRYSELPAPRVGIPARTARSGTLSEKRTIYAAPGAVNALRCLSKVFPGIHVVDLGQEISDVEERVATDAILVVGSEELRSHWRLARCCTRNSVPFLNADMLPNHANVAYIARELLTNFPLSERRCAEARLQASRKGP